MKNHLFKLIQRKSIKSLKMRDTEMAEITLLVYFAFFLKRETIYYVSES